MGMAQTRLVAVLLHFTPAVPLAGRVLESFSLAKVALIADVGEGTSIVVLRYVRGHAHSRVFNNACRRKAHNPISGLFEQTQKSGLV